MSAVLWVVGGLMALGVACLVYGACVVAGQCSREEEAREYTRCEYTRCEGQDG